MESSHPPFPFDQQGLVALKRLSAPAALHSRRPDWLITACVEVAAWTSSSTYGSVGCLLSLGDLLNRQRGRLPFDELTGSAGLDWFLVDPTMYKVTGSHARP